MVPAGGAANIHGIVFQILRTAQWAVRLRLTSAPGKLTSARLVAEPRSGGDLHIRFPDRLIVQQFKTRSRNKTWSLREVIDQVLPDLYSMVDQGTVRNMRFEFVTNGRMGNWRQALEFFDQLGKREPPKSPLHKLDNRTAVRFFGTGRCSRRELFASVCDAVRQHSPANSEPMLVTRRKVWLMLGRFRFVQTPDLETSKKSLLAMLSGFVADEAAAVVASNAVIVELLEYSRKGNAEFTPEDLLKNAGIDPQAFSGSEPLREAARQIVRRETRELVRFRPELSVRSPHAWDGPSRLLCFRGPAGSGKSWALAALASEGNWSNRSSLAAFTRASGNAREDLLKLAKHIHEDLLGSGVITSLDKARELAEDVMPTAEPWLTACIDDVAFDELQMLASLPLAQYGLRVAVTVREREASRSAIEGLGVQVLDVGDFTDDELTDFLRRNGRRARDIREDMLDPMRRPLLAELYVHGTSAQWTPTNEYAFYDACWQALPDEADRRHLRLIARLSLDDLSSAWKTEVLLEQGLPDHSLDRLEALGWLRRDQDKVSIWHERLLNWAVAESIVADHSADIGELTAWIAFCARSIEPSAATRLGYVPMDALWLCLTRKSLTAARAAELLKGLEDEDLFRVDVLHTDLLPTLGLPVVRPLLVRASQATPVESWSVEINTWRALKSVITDSPGLAGDIVGPTLASESDVLQKIGVRLALSFPSERFVDDLWRIYRRLARTPELPGEESDSGIAAQNSELIFSRERAFSALTRSARLNLNWLKNVIRDETEDFEPVLWLLSNMDSGAGRELWLELKQTIFEKAPPGGERALLSCIRTARDDVEVPRVLGILQNGDKGLLASTAFATLAVLAPDLALQRLSHVNAADLAFTRSWWLPWLILRRPEATTDVLRARIEGDENAVPYLAQCYFGHEEYLNGATVAAFLGWLAKDIARYLVDGDDRRHVRLGDVVELLVKGANAELLDVFASLDADFVADLEKLCDKLFASHEGHARLPAHHVSALLRLVSRDAFCGFMGRHIAATTLTREKAEWAIACGSNVALLGLRSIALGPQANPRSSSEVILAIRSLAAMGDTQGVIDAVMLHDNRTHVDVPLLLAEHAPFQKRMLKEPLSVLRHGDEAAQTRAIGALGLSGRKVLVSPVARIARKASRSSALRRIALYAVADLMYDGQPVEDMLGSFDDWAENHVIIAWLLRRSGSERALSKLEELIRTSSSTGLTSRYDVAIDTIDDTDRGRRIAEFVWSKIRSWPFAMWHDDWVDKIIPYVHDAEIRKRAARESRDFDTNAIRALSYYDPTAAFDEAAAALRTEQRDRQQMARLLMDLDESRAVPSLVEHARWERALIVRSAIGRALRRARNANAAAAPVREMLADSNSDVRAAACELGGWLPGIDEWRLSQRATEDVTRRVQRNALTALGRRRAFNATHELLGRLKAVEGFDAWRAAEMAVRTGDAQLLAARGDVLCIWPALATKPRALRFVVNGWLEERDKEIARSESWDSRRDEDF